MQKKILVCLTTTLLLVGAGMMTEAQAALVNRGGGMIYDTDYNITWLQDANYAMTSGYDADGQMTWPEALDWAANLDYGGYSSGWRLPTTLHPDGSEITSGIDIKSEMGHLYYTELGNSSGALTNSGPFINIQPSWYWSSTSTYLWYYEWIFNFTDGDQGGVGWGYYTAANIYAWAVRDGDVAPVPLPGAVWLLGSGFAGLLAVRRGKNRTSQHI